jgi:ribonuclease G
VRLLIESGPESIRIALLEGERLAELHAEGSQPSRVGEIYLGRVQRLVPAIDAAFVDVGLGRNAFLRADDFVTEGEAPPIVEHERLIVQIARDAVPGKGARVRRTVSLPGRYLVLLAPGDGVAASLRIADEDERQRLIAAVEECASSDFGWILRTVAVGADEADLAAEADALAESWRRIVRQAAESRTPQLLHRDLDPVERWLRDRLDDDVVEIWVDSAEQEARIRTALERVAPPSVKRLRVHEGALSLFERFGVEKELANLWNRAVALPSGGSIVIEPTEALVAIDVNSGRDVGAANLEQTALATNLEAALEVARQIRLRDLAGIIVVDFIDMSIAAGWDEVRRALEDELARDRAVTLVEGPVAFGLMAITRKRARNDLMRLLSVECPECNGDGRIRSPGEVASGVSRALSARERERPGRRWRVILHSSVAAQLDPAGSPTFRRLREEFGERLAVESSSDIRRADFQVLEVIP